MHIGKGAPNPRPANHTAWPIQNRPTTDRPADLHTHFTPPACRQPTGLLLLSWPHPSRPLQAQRERELLLTSTRCSRRHDDDNNNDNDDDDEDDVDDDAQAHRRLPPSFLPPRNCQLCPPLPVSSARRPKYLPATVPYLLRVSCLG